MKVTKLTVGGLGASAAARPEAQVPLSVHQPLHPLVGTLQLQAALTKQSGSSIDFHFSHV